MERVCHIITKLELGGAQQNTLFTVAHLNPSTFHPILIVGESGFLDAEARALPHVEFHQVPVLVRRMHPLRDLQALWVLTRLLRRLRPTIVHTHSSKAGILGRIAAKLAGVPIIIHSIHGFGFTPRQHSVYRRALIFAERTVSAWTTRFFSVSEANRRQGIAHGLFPPDRCTVIRSGVDFQAIRQVTVSVPEKKRTLGLDRDRPVVGVIAAMKPQKAPLDFVRLAAVVAATRPDCQFVMVGDGELRPMVEAEIRRLTLDRAFHLLGWRRDVPDILRCLNVLVLPSLWEGLPRVYLEAILSGVPIVGTRVDGGEEVVRDGITGYLVEPGDILGMATRVLEIFNEGWQRPSDSPESLLGPEFDIWEMVHRQEAEYLQLIRECRPDPTSLPVTG